jgi:sarcosine oxidase subunit beta
MKFSGIKVLKEALTGHKGWKPLWRLPEPKPVYDIIIVGGGGHGLATAYHLAATFGITNIAVLEKGWLGSGNIGRNTTIIRSNYLLPGNQPFYEFSMKLWETQEQDLNFNSMVSQRSIIIWPIRTRSATPTDGAAMPCISPARAANCCPANNCARWCLS